MAYFQCLQGVLLCPWVIRGSERQVLTPIQNLFIVLLFGLTFLNDLLLFYVCVCVVSACI